MSNDQYRPLQNGITKTLLSSITYTEQKPDKNLSGIVHCFWTLKSNQRLDEDFVYSVMPDACVDVVFDESSTSEPIIMTPHLKIEEINLGRSFHYTGVRFKPGVLNPAVIPVSTIVGKQIKLKSLTAQNTIQSVLAEFVESDIIALNTFIENVITGMQFGLSVHDIAQKVGLSTRQLQRKAVKQTGFTPIQLQRVLRFQMALSKEDITLRFADQSHLIKEFKSITGMTYNQFTASFE